MHLPIESDSYFNTYAPIPEKFRKFLIPSARYHFKSDDANASLDMNIRLDGFSVWIHYLWLANNLLLYPFNTKDTYALHYWLSGSIPAELRDQGLVKVEDCTLFFLKAMEHTAWAASGTFLSIHINIDPDNITDLINKYPQLSLLKDLPQYTISTPVNPIPFNINAVCIRLLKRILHCRYIGIAGECYLLRNCVSLFGNYLKELKRNNTRILVKREEKRKLYRILQYAANHPEKIHSYENLAAMFQIDLIAMRLGFEQEFHMSLYDFILQEQMNRAFDWLMTGNYSVEKIARELNYPATFLFNADFELFFGCDPLILQMPR